ncbi:MAG TPA: family 16 glycosylhydrolase [Thermoplasmata archaeon]|nr:family 16 glycosylhydrolase [Thermoplasmata archaeon]
MNKSILAIVVITLLISTAFVGCMKQKERPMEKAKIEKPKPVRMGEVPFHDDFDSDQLSEYWSIRKDYTGTHCIEDGVLELTLPYAEGMYYSNAEVFTKGEKGKSTLDHTNLPYKFNTLKIRAKVDPIAKGSFGWGFYTGSAEIKNAKSIWFIHLNTPGWYPMKGFNAQCSNGSLLKMSTHRLGEYNLSKWHEYEIRWTERGAEFYIDDELVYKNSENVPSGNLKFHAWIDNAVFLPRFFPFIFGEGFPFGGGIFRPITHEIPYPTTVYIDYVEIT